MGAKISTLKRFFGDISDIVVKLIRILVFCAGVLLFFNAAIAGFQNPNLSRLALFLFASWAVITLLYRIEAAQLQNNEELKKISEALTKLGEH